MTATFAFRRLILFVTILCAIGGIAFAFGMAWGTRAHADEGNTSDQTAASKKGARVVYPKRTELDFEGLAIEGEVKNPGEFYFQHRNEDKFDSLVQRRKNFHREMLRDAVLSK